MAAAAVPIARGDDYTPFYGFAGTQTTSSWSITPKTNTLGLPDWRKVTVTFSFSITARATEGFSSASVSLPGTPGASASNVGSGSAFSGTLSFDDSSPFQGKTYTATSSLSGWDSGQPNWSVSSSSTSPGVSGSGNTLGPQPGVSWNGSTTVTAGTNIGGIISGGAASAGSYGFAVFGATGWTDAPSGTVTWFATMPPSGNTWSMDVYKDAGGDYAESPHTNYTIIVLPPKHAPTTSTSSDRGSFTYGSTPATITFQANDSDGNLKTWRFYDPTRNPTAGTSPASGYQMGPAPYTMSSTSTPGTYTYVTEATDTDFLAGSSSATITVNQASQGIGISVSPSSGITTATTVTFTATGGAGSGAWSWGGSASGSNASTNVNFPTAGTYTVTLNKAGDVNYNAAPPASATVTVVNAITQRTVSFSIPDHTYGDGAFGVSASSNGDGSPSYSVVSGPISLSGNTVTILAAGSAQVRADYSATASFTSGSATASFTIVPRAMTVSVTPVSSVITVGNSVTFNASGGVNGYIWGGSAAGSGSSQPVTFPSAGTFTVTVYSPAGGNYATSNTATASITVQTPGSLSYAGNTSFGTAYRDSQAGSPTSTTQTFTLTNIGDTALTITAISLTGNYSLASGPTLPFSLSGRTATTITLRFTPGPTTGSNPGTCTISTSANSPSITLSGSGVAPRVNVNWH